MTRSALTIPRHHCSSRFGKGLGFRLRHGLAIHLVGIAFWTHDVCMSLSIALWIAYQYGGESGGTIAREAPETAPVWQYILTYGLFVVVFAGFVALAYWGYRRRIRGVEASTYNAAGAEAIAHPPSNI